MTIEYLCHGCLTELKVLETGGVQTAHASPGPRRFCGCGKDAHVIAQHAAPAFEVRKAARSEVVTTLAEILQVYAGSDGDATTRLYERLALLGAAGTIAVNLFRASKNSARAKVYRGKGYRGAAYDRKQWAMDNLAKILAEHAEACALRWGWNEDPKQEFHRWVLYVDLPTGQVSFHTAARGTGPGYAGAWDGVVDASAGRICSWCAQLLSKEIK